MNFSFIVARLLAASLALFAASPAVAQANSPTGTWEIAVGGKFQGEKVSGIAYIEFSEGGVLEGYFLSRRSGEVSEVEGSWSQVGNKFTGSLDVFNGSGETVGSLDMAGAARAGKSISARLTDDVGSRVTLSGKPFAGLSNLSGGYSGSQKQYGQTGDLSIVLSSLDANGAYDLTGSLEIGGESYSISGYVLANRKGEFVAIVYNETEDVYASIWGKIAGTSVKASGLSLDDGSKIQIRLTSSGN